MPIKLQSPLVFEGKEKEVVEKVYPKVKDILRLLASGSAVAAVIIMPGLPLAFQREIRNKYKNKKLGRKEIKNWEKYKTWRVRSQLKRLREQKDIKFERNDEGFPVLELTEKGEKKLLKYNLKDLNSIKVEEWDEEWRVIIYDIPKKYDSQRREFQNFIKNLEIIQLQKSVYLTPYPCENLISYLRELLRVGPYVKLLKVSNLEDEEVYKDYFNLG